MPYLSRIDLETLGEQVFSDYKSTLGIQSSHIQKVDPEVLAQKLCKLKIEYYHLSRSRTILGLTSTSIVGVKVLDAQKNLCVYRLDGRTILIEKDLKDDSEQCGRYHFTLAHEVAHQILDRLYPEHIGCAARVHCSKGNCKPSYPVIDWSEWQANALASSLLMPVEVVFNTLCQFDLANGIKTLNKIFFPEVYDRFCQMAQLLEVSKQALALRLKRLGILGEAYLDDPYRLVDVEV